MHKLLVALQERREDLAVIHEYFVDEGESAIVEMLPPVKYFIGTLIDILNDGLGGFWGDLTKPNFYALFGQLEEADAQLHQQMFLARDDFDKGAIWIISRLNAANLSEALVHFVLERPQFEGKYSKRALLMNAQETEELIRIVRSIETSIKFDLRAEDLYVMRPRMTPRLSPLNSPLNEETEIDSCSPELYSPPALEDRAASPKPGIFSRILAKTASITEKFKSTKPVKLGTINSAPLLAEEFDCVQIESVSVKKPEVSLLDMQICPERGLAAQNYSCVACRNGIGLNDAVRCDFSGEYYCRTCHGSWEGVNPVRLIRNWDTKKYPISAASRKIISQIDYSELIDFAAVNPKIFKELEAFSYISGLRKEIVKMAQRRLTRLSQSDRKKQLARMEKLAWPKNHLLTSSKLYTIEDLTEIASGTFYTRVLLPIYNVLKL